MNHCIHLNMAVSKHFTCSLLVIVVLMLPVPVGECVNGFPDDIRTTPTVSSSANTSYFTHVDQTYSKSVVRSVQVTRTCTVRETCCAGFSGEHCNITNTTSPQPQQVSADDPCGNLTYSSYPDAVCAVMTKFSEKIPVFFNSAGIVVDCGNHRPIEELRRTKCGNVCTCPFDPCLGKTCSPFLNAACLTIAPCDCKPLWLLENGVRVDCSSGEH